MQSAPLGRRRVPHLFDPDPTLRPKSGTLRFKPDLGNQDLVESADRSRSSGLFSDGPIKVTGRSRRWLAKWPRAARGIPLAPIEPYSDLLKGFGNE